MSLIFLCSFLQKLLAFPSVFVLLQQQAAGSSGQEQQVLTLAAEHATMQQRSDAVAGVLETLRKEQVGWLQGDCIIKILHAKLNQTECALDQACYVPPTLDCDASSCCAACCEESC
jgi:hypothetical protein